MADEDGVTGRSHDASSFAHRVQSSFGISSPPKKNLKRPASSPLHSPQHTKPFGISHIPVLTPGPDYLQYHGSEQHRRLAIRRQRQPVSPVKLSRAVPSAQTPDRIIEIFDDETATDAVAPRPPSPSKLLKFNTAAEIVSSPAFQEIVNNSGRKTRPVESIKPQTTTKADPVSPLKKARERRGEMVLYSSSQAARSSPLAYQTPSPSLRQRLSKYGHLPTPRSMGRDQGRYITFLECKLVDLEQKLHASLSPASTKAQRLQIKDLGAETQHLQTEVVIWKDKFEVELKQKIRDHHQSEQKLLSEIEALETENVEKQARIEQLEKELNQADRREKEVERLQSHNIDLGKRVDSLARLLAQSSIHEASPTRESFGPATRPSGTRSPIRKRSLPTPAEESEPPAASSYQRRGRVADIEHEDHHDLLLTRYATSGSHHSSGSIDTPSVKVANPYHVRSSVSDSEGDEACTVAKARRTRQFPPGSSKKPLILGQIHSAASSPTRAGFDDPPGYSESWVSPSRMSAPVSPLPLPSAGVPFLQAFDFEHQRATSTRSQTSQNERLSPVQLNDIRSSPPILNRQSSGFCGSDEGTPRANNRLNTGRQPDISLFHELDGMSQWQESSPCVRPPRQSCALISQPRSEEPSPTLSINTGGFNKDSVPALLPRLSLQRSHSPLRASETAEYDEISPLYPSARAAGYRISSAVSNIDGLIAVESEYEVSLPSQTNSQTASRHQDLEDSISEVDELPPPAIPISSESEGDLISLPLANVGRRKSLIHGIWSIVSRGLHGPIDLAQTAASLALRRAQDLDESLGLMAWRLISRAVHYQYEADAQRPLSHSDLESGSLHGSRTEEEEFDDLLDGGEEEALLKTRQREKSVLRIRRGFVGYCFERLGLWIRLELTLVMLIVVALRKGPESVLDEGRRVIDREGGRTENE